MFVNAQLHAVVLDLQAVRVVGGKGFVCFVRGVKVAPHLTRVGVHNSLNHPSGYDNPLFAKPKLPHKAVENNINSVQCFHGVGVDRNAKRGVVVYVVGRRRAEIRKKAVLQAVDRCAFVHERVQLCQRYLNTENVLRLRAFVFIYFRPIKFVGDVVGQAVPFVPLQAGVVISALCDPGNKGALGDLRVIPRRRDKLIGHAKADFQAFGAWDFISLPVPADFPPHFHSFAAKRRGLFYGLQHFGAECVIFQDLFYPRFQWVHRLRFRRLKSVRGNAHVRLVRPYHPGQLGTHGF